MTKKASIREAVDQIFKALSVDGEFEIEENDEGFDIKLETTDSGIVIGHHGDTLEALQIIISLTLSKKLGEFKRVSIEIGDYKKNRSEYLTNLALETKEKVLATNKEIFIPDLKSWERRIVHMLLQEDKDVSSESIGEGKDRILVVKPRK